MLSKSTRRAALKSGGGDIGKFSHALRSVTLFLVGADTTFGSSSSLTSSSFLRVVSRAALSVKDAFSLLFFFSSKSDPSFLLASSRNFSTSSANEDTSWYCYIVEERRRRQYYSLLRGIESKKRVVLARRVNLSARLLKLSLIHI